MLYNKFTKTIKYICFLRILNHIFKILCFFYHGVPLLLSVLLAYLHKSTPYHLLTNVVIWNKHIPTIEYFPTPFQKRRPPADPIPSITPYVKKFQQVWQMRNMHTFLFSSLLSFTYSQIKRKKTKQIQNIRGFVYDTKNSFPVHTKTTSLRSISHNFVYTLPFLPSIIDIDIWNGINLLRSPLNTR